ncbi:MAG: PilT/PilU family type 4a pilus ATPase [Actinobacteria bacterium]|nr:PilT/PilU family type 4a pilus ATPase [Actinomycetota bacterium]
MSRELLDSYLTQLLLAGGSDLHLRVGGQPRIRVNGVLEPLPGTSVLREQDTEAMAAAAIRPNLVERFRRGEEVDFAYALPGGHGRFRVNAYLQRDTVALVFRTVATWARTIADLGLPDIVRRFAEEPRGLVLVAGPTGSGKTTTLAAMVDHINHTRTVHIVTIEDPIEVMHVDENASISQRELGADTPSFASAMRASLRQDPDVILVGEMRDAETVSTALLAAETGHLVLSTLHTTDATETISRIVEFFPPHEQRQVRLVLAGVLRGTICQRLIPTRDGNERVPATEIMVVNGRVQDWIVGDTAGRGDVQEIIAEGDYYGMHTFDQCILDLYEKGVIDRQGAMTASTSPHDLTVELRRRGLETGRG